MKDYIYEKNPKHKYESLKLCSPEVSQLFISGKHPEILEDKHEKLRVGIVGTRDATSAGLADTRRLAQVVASVGGIVVSGMAIGVDGAAHEGAIEAGGKTIAVLGSGLGNIYPLRHKLLSKCIQENGCIITEYDVDTKALAWHFPIRNRIIAALSDVLVVPEGTLKGGARITVDLALAMGKTIAAIPGPRRNRASELPNAIIRDGALCLTDPSELLFQMGIDSETLGWDFQKQRISSNPDIDEKIVTKVMAEMAHNPLSRGQISNICSYDEQDTIRLLTKLENAGQIRFSRGLYELKAQ